MENGEFTRGGENFTRFHAPCFVFTCGHFNPTRQSHISVCNSRERKISHLKSCGLLCFHIWNILIDVRKIAITYEFKCKKSKLLVTLSFNYSNCMSHVKTQISPIFTWLVLFALVENSNLHVKPNTYECM